MNYHHLTYKNSLHAEYLRQMNHIDIIFMHTAQYNYHIDRMYNMQPGNVPTHSNSVGRTLFTSSPLCVRQWMRCEFGMQEKKIISIYRIE